MNFLKLFLRAIVLIPGVVQGTEALFGAKTGEQKKTAAVEIVGAAINIADAVTILSPSWNPNKKVRSNPLSGTATNLPEGSKMTACGWDDACSFGFGPARPCSGIT